MELKELIRGLSVEISGVVDIEIRQISSDSRLCVPGSLFIVKKSAASFIPKACENGAIAILTDVYNPFLKEMTQLIYPEPQELESILAARFYHHPSQKLFVCGVTGTNGKTTSVYLVKQLLDRLGLSAGLLSTVETIVGERSWSSSLTTHDVLTNQKYLCAMREQGHRSAVIEVSSHGLVQGRVANIEFDVAIFTNLSPDHLDYHHTMQEYTRAKKRLFQFLEQSAKGKKCAIVNADDPYSPQMLEGLTVPSLSFGLRCEADLWANAIETTVHGTEFFVHTQLHSVRMKTQLVGEFNVRNVLGMIAVGMHLGMTLDDLRPIVAQIRGAPGRLERVDDAAVFIDYAHTEDALDNVLRTVRFLTRGKVIVVFGAGGGRDQGRRAGLARAAERGADLAIVTSDNPRQEDPVAICREILAGFSSLAKVLVELDRKKAIEKAIERMGPDDLVLIAGKGHEKTQIFAHETIPFDDRVVAREVCRCLR
jgi:UDP-N-acetylmuramoyl-L-alanyl-D-glutamate--2,6-diaminopimelate ligase